MFWSSSSPSSTSGASSSLSSSSSLPSSGSSSSASSTSGSVPASTWSSSGPAGLGVISSLSPECTPLKHRYDSCFDRWFTDYLAIGDAQILVQQRQGSGASVPSQAAAPPKKKSSWFGGSDDGAPSASAGSGLFSTSNGRQATADPELEGRKRDVMERYDRDCGKLFREYRGCVKRAASAKGLDALIEEARAENPFPFDHQRQNDERENNPPFPFPAARRPSE